MRTSVSCIRVIYRNKCTECGETISDKDEEIVYVTLTELINYGNPMCCQCESDYIATGEVEVLA